MYINSEFTTFLVYIVICNVDKLKKEIQQYDKLKIKNKNKNKPIAFFQKM